MSVPASITASALSARKKLSIRLYRLSMLCIFNYLKCRRHLPNAVNTKLYTIFLQVMKSRNCRPTITICLQPSLTCLMVLSTCGKEYIMRQNNPCYLFGMYEPDTDSIIINALNDTYTGTSLTISCEKCNSAVLLDTPDDIAYLYRLAQESPLLYAELACKSNGLQEYVDAMNEFN